MTLPLAASAAPIRGGTPAFRRICLALFAGGFATFSLLYCAQALLPQFSADFGVSPAASSLTVSFATFALALMMVVSGSLSEALGRRGFMAWSLAAASLFTLAAAAAPDFRWLLVFRLLAGVALSGLPAVIMAYVGEEVESGSIGLAIGLSIGGNAFGGMMGRVASAAIADFQGWRIALAIMGGTGLLAALVFWHALPPSRRFVRQKLRWRDSIEGLALHFRDPALCWLYATAFLIMGGFVTIYNYLGYRLLAPPFGFSQTAVGALFSVYVVGIVASGLAARLAERFGRRRMLWIAVAVQLAGLELTLGRTTLPVVGGVAVLTGGFFGAHSIASAWVARRATSRRAQAASLYMLFYYLGSSLVGSLGGVVFADHGWSGLVLLLSLLGCVSLGVAFRLSVIPTLAVPGAIRHDASDVTRRGMTG